MNTPEFWAEQDALLRNDNVRGWRADGRYCNDHLDAWVKNNVFHAHASCPQVMKYWKDDVILWQDHEVVLAEYTALALETRSDAWKEHFLRGHPNGSLQGALFARLYLPNAWEIFSPSWIGKPGSGLRERATALGWTPTVLPKQVANHLDMGAAHLWGPSLNFPYTMAVLSIHDHEVMRKKRGPIHSAVIPSVSLIAQEWANPKDVVIAARLAQQFTGIVLGYNVKFGPQEHGLQAQDIQVLHTLVDMHISLGMLDELRGKVLDGTLLTTHEDVLTLPPLSEDTHGI